MSAIIDRNYDNVRLTSFVRSIPQRTGDVLSLFLPDRDVQTRTFKIRTQDITSRAAQFRAYDTPSPIAPIEGFTELSGQLAPISEAIVIGEDEELSVYERTVAGVYDSTVEEDINKKAARLVNNVRNRMSQARAEALETGAIAIAENGVTGTITFGVPAGNLALTAAVAWATVATSTPIADMRGWMEQSLDERDEPIAYAVMSSTQVSNLLQTAEIRNLLNAGGITPDRVTLGAVQNLFTAHGLPQIVVNDYKVAGTAVQTATEVILLPEPSDRFGRTEYGITAESLKLDLSYQDRPGIVGTVKVSEDPVQTKVDVTALGMPVLNDPTLVYVADVS